MRRIAAVSLLGSLFYFPRHPCLCVPFVCIQTGTVSDEEIKPESTGASIKSEEANGAVSPGGATVEAAVQEGESGEPNYWSILIGATEFGEPEEPAQQKASTPKAMEMEESAHEERRKQVCVPQSSRVRVGCGCGRGARGTREEGGREGCRASKCAEYFRCRPSRSSLVCVTLPCVLHTGRPHVARGGDERGWG